MCRLLIYGLESTSLRVSCANGMSKKDGIDASLANLSGEDHAQRNVWAGDKDFRERLVRPRLS